MPQPDSSVRREALARAAQLAGGSQSLRRKLHVSAALLALWLSGGQSLPTDIFLKAVDIIDEHAIKSLRKED